MIKILTPNDADVILKLQHQTPSRNWSAAEAEKLLSRDWVTAFGLKVDGTFIGLCVLKIIESEAEILELAIDNPHRKKGCARQLWNHVQKTFPKSTFFLEVSEYNIPAIKFYEEMEFKNIGCRKDYYRPGESALVYKIIN